MIFFVTLIPATGHSLLSSFIGAAIERLFFYTFFCFPWIASFTGKKKQYFCQFYPPTFTALFHPHLAAERHKVPLFSLKSSGIVHQPRLVRSNCPSFDFFFQATNLGVIRTSLSAPPPNRSCSRLPWCDSFPSVSLFTPIPSHTSFLPSLWSFSLPLYALEQVRSLSSNCK